MMTLDNAKEMRGDINACGECVFIHKHTQHEYYKCPYNKGYAIRDLSKIHEYCIFEEETPRPKPANPKGPKNTEYMIAYT